MTEDTAQRFARMLGEHHKAQMRDLGLTVDKDAPARTHEGGDLPLHTPTPVTVHTLGQLSAYLTGHVEGINGLMARGAIHKDDEGHAHGRLEAYADTLALVVQLMPYLAALPSPTGSPPTLGRAAPLRVT